MRDGPTTAWPTISDRKLAEPIDQSRGRTHGAGGEGREVEAAAVDPHAVVSVAVRVVLARRLVRKGEA